MIPFFVRTGLLLTFVLSNEVSAAIGSLEPMNSFSGCGPLWLPGRDAPTHACFKARNGWVLLGGDMVLGRAEEVLVGSMGSNSKSQDETNENTPHKEEYIGFRSGNRNSTRYLWQNGLVPYVVSEDLGLELRRQVASAMEHYHQRTTVRFVRRTDQDDYVEIRNTGSNAASASLARNGGKQFIWLPPKSSLGVIIHELGHTLGLQHEHQRPDRDDYVKVHLANIGEEHRSEFAIIRDDASTLAHYDYDSVMHYGSFDFKRTNAPTMTRRGGELLSENRVLSRGDVQAINELVKLAGGPSEIVRREEERPSYLLGITARTRTVNGISHPRLINVVPNSTAHAYGLRIGDVITRVEGSASKTDVADERGIHEAVQANRGRVVVFFTRAGNTYRTAEMRVPRSREGDVASFDGPRVQPILIQAASVLQAAPIVSGPAPSQLLVSIQPPQSQEPFSLGLYLIERMSITGAPEVSVTSVVSTSAADLHGFLPGDVLTRIEGRQSSENVVSERQVRALIQVNHGEVRVFFRRNGVQYRTVLIRVPRARGGITAPFLGTRSHVIRLNSLIGSNP